MTKAVAAKSWNLAASNGRRYSCGSTALAAACAGLTAGQCIKFADLPEALFEASGESADITKYASHGVYDIRRRQVRFIGRRESANFPYHAISYGEGTNTWALDAFELWTTDSYTSGHAYAHNAINLTNGNHIFRPYGSNEVWEEEGGEWTQLPSLGTVGVNLEVAGALLHVPGHGLLHYDRRRMKQLTDGAGSWTQIHDFGAHDNAYQANAQYNPISRVIILGGGNTDALMFKIDTRDPDLTLEAIETPPFNFGTSEDQSILVPDPAGPNFIAWNKKTDDWVEYDVGADEYNAITQADGNGSVADTGTPNISTASGGHSTFGVPLWRYGCIMVVQSTGGGGTAWLYKHS